MLWSLSREMRSISKKGMQKDAIRFDDVLHPIRLAALRGEREVILKDISVQASQYLLEECFNIEPVMQTENKSVVRVSW